MDRREEVALGIAAAAAAALGECELEKHPDARFFSHVLDELRNIADALRSVAIAHREMVAQLATATPYRLVVGGEHEYTDWTTAYFADRGDAEIFCSIHGWQPVTDTGHCQACLDETDPGRLTV